MHYPKLPFLLLCASLLLASCHDQPKTVAHVEKKNAIKKTTIAGQPDSAIHIVAVGDIMLGTTYPNPYNLPPDSGKHSFKAATQYLRTADVTFGNLEGTLLDTGAPQRKSKAYLFRMPTRYGQLFKDAGFSLLSLANNHINDFGQRGRTSTMQTLDSLGIYNAGLQAKPSVTFTVKGVKYGFCAFSPNSYVVSLHDFDNATNIIQKLKQQVDIVIVSFHGGGEGTGYQHVPGQKESFIGENRGDVHAFAHNAIDAGADLILGNGPHVSRALELYKNRLIAYSLGNFCTYKSVSVAGVCGLAPLLKANLNKRGEFLNGRLIAFKQTHANGLMRDTLNQVITCIKNLTETDFPQSGLFINADGAITPAK